MGRVLAIGMLLIYLVVSGETLLAQNRTSAPASAIEDWRKREAAVLDVVQKATDSVVAVTDHESVGSGVVVSKDGLILTAGHVIMSGAKEYDVSFPDGRTAKAKPLGKNLNQDAGMLQIVDPGDWPYVDIADGQNVQRGDWVVAIGHSGGFDLGRRPPVRVGRLIRVDRDALTSDSPIVGGDSGGPLFNLEGQVIGIHSSIGESIAENRHVSLRTFLRDWDRLKAGESWGNLPGTRPQRETPPAETEPQRPDEPRRGQRGRNPQGNPGQNNPGQGNSNQGKAEQVPLDSAVLGVEMDQNDLQAIIREIKPNSAAARVGLKVGDIVESFNGSAVTTPITLVEMIRTKRAGDSVKLVVRRGGDQLEYQIILGQLETR